MIVDVPEPFATALESGELVGALDVEATSPEALYGRGLVRASLGRGPEARLDFEAALPAIGDACRVELALLAIRERSAVAEACEDAIEIAARNGGAPALRARALHVRGLAEGKLRRTGPSIDALIGALDLYRQLGDRRGCAQVHDTLGMVHAARGRLDHAVHHHAMSIVDKSVMGDRAGMAITLGNVGQLHLRAGRLVEAQDCFALDLQLTRELGDLHGEARMLEDIGRTHLANGRLDLAESSLRECLSMTGRLQQGPLEFFARKDLALVHLAAARLDEAERELESAERVLPKGGEAYLALLLRLARAEVALARGVDVVDELTDLVTGFVTAELPDFEIGARVALARALSDSGCVATAEQNLLLGAKRARSAGYARHLRILNEAMGELQLVESAVDESGRRAVSAREADPDSYVLREKLGSGAFGEVHRAYDPERGREVAFKRLRFEEVDDQKTRDRLLASARLELEAASRIRHPGVARVHAIGREPEGSVYVVQDFVQGRPLRGVMPDDSSARLGEVLDGLVGVLSALEVLHAAGVIHRDLKPENIVIRPDGRPVLVDFGIAHVVGGRSMAGDHVGIGTLPYMAPEQALGRRIDPKADLYSVGVILFEWLAGVRPLSLRGESLQERVRDLQQRPPPPISDFRPGVGRELEDLVAELLAKRPRHRPPNAASVADRLRDLAGAQGTAS